VFLQSALQTLRKEYPFFKTFHLLTPMHVSDLLITVQSEGGNGRCRKPAYDLIGCFTNSRSVNYTLRLSSLTLIIAVMSAF